MDIKHFYPDTYLDDANERGGSDFSHKANQQASRQNTNSQSNTASGTNTSSGGANTDNSQNPLLSLLSNMGGGNNQNMLSALLPMMMGGGNNQNLSNDNAMINALSSMLKKDSCNNEKPTHIKRACEYQDVNDYIFD